MATSHLLVLILMAILATGGCSCPTWYYNDSGGCHCGSELHGGLICHDWNQTVEISAGFCMTYDANRDGMSTLVVGDCPFGYFSDMTNRRYSLVPGRRAEVNSNQCDPYNRKGLLCGQCKKGFGPAVYSFNFQCANCSTIPTAAAISLYALMELVPITIFFFFVLIFRLNLMSGPKLGYVIFCQAIMNTSQYSRYTYTSLFSNLSRPLAIFGHIGLVLSGIWNLQFFRFITPPFCISERMTDLHLQILQFSTALYPLFLVLVTYSIIELNARYDLIRKCIIRFPPMYNVGHSIIHAFATFMMLSMFSTLCQGYAILQTSRLRDMYDLVIMSVLFCNPDIVMFSRKHLPYLIISLALVFILAMCPALLLCLYPTRVYGKLSRYLSVRKQLAVKIFVETVHGEFKDGLNNTRDYRMIPGIIIISGLTYSLLMSILPHHGFSGFPPLTIGLIIVFVSFLVSYLHPCKSLLTNMSLSFHLLLISVMSLLIALWWQDLMLDTDILASTIVSISIIPHALMITWIGHYVLQKYNCCSHGVQVVQKVFNIVSEKCKRKTNHIHNSLLHEIANNEEQPLLAAQKI